MSLFSELQRRNVLRVAIVYLASSWLLIQIVETLFPLFGLAEAQVRLVVILLVIGFPLVAIFSWLYELTLLVDGDAQAAVDAIEQEPIEMFRLSGLAFAYHELGQADESDKYLAELIDKHESDAPAEVASVFAWRGHNDNAFEWLEKARENNPASLANVASQYSFRNLHDDPRWQPFLAKMGQSDAQLSAIEFDVRLPKQGQSK